MRVQTLLVAGLLSPWGSAMAVEVVVEGRVQARRPSPCATSPATGSALPSRKISRWMCRMRGFFLMTLRFARARQPLS